MLMGAAPVHDQAAECGVGRSGTSYRPAGSSGTVAPAVATPRRLAGAAGRRATQDRHDWSNRTTWDIGAIIGPSPRGVSTWPVSDPP
jgi:hypothetical protein